MGLDKQPTRHRSAPMTENRATSARPELCARPDYGILAGFPPELEKSSTESRLGRAKVHFEWFSDAILLVSAERT